MTTHHDDELVLLLLQVGPFFGHHNAQELVFEALGSSHEVKERYLNRPRLNCVSKGSL